MIKTFSSKTLREFFLTGSTKGMRPDLAKRVAQRLQVLNNAKVIGDLNMPGYRLHRYKGQLADVWSIDVGHPWRLLFKWDGKDAYDVDLRQDH